MNVRKVDAWVFAEPVPDWLLRLVQERRELCDRLGKLAMFMDAPAFKQLDRDDRMLLEAQRAAMETLERLLRARLLRHHIPSQP